MPTIPDFNFRTYVRTNNWNVRASISEDSEEWFDVQVPDISAGGLQFVTERKYEPSDKLRIKLYIDPLMSGSTNPFLVDAALIIRRLRAAPSGRNSYSSEFTEMSNEDKVRLDILINWTMENFGRSDFKDE
ncbi:MAG: PilZ domain-containing protein [Oscillospiraceae bacterium]|nr:PilZ domain-containing protein [Oscillospiraceae bacterium]